MSKIVSITSKAQFDGLLKSSRVVVVDFYADWCPPCKAIAPVYEQLASQLARPNKVTFTKVNVDTQTDVAQAHSITAMPTFMVFKNGAAVSTIRGADKSKLADAVQKLAAEADNDSGSGAGGFAEASSGAGGNTWLGASVPRGYSDITEHVDVRGLDLLNADPAFGDARGLFAAAKPSALAPDKGKGKGAAGGDAAEDAKRDWVESDSDEQLMLLVPFQARVRVHTLLLTSLPPTDGADDEAPKRPRTVHLYINTAGTLGFEEAEGVTPTQAVTIRPDDWDPATGTAKAELRFVKFQSVTSLVVFVVDGEEVDGRGERVRLDRIRVLGEVGEKRELGKLEKIGDASGE